jgi:hypothetical protein
MRSPGYSFANYLRIRYYDPSWPRTVGTCTERCRSYPHAILFEEENFLFTCAKLLRCALSWQRSPR